MATTEQLLAAALKEHFGFDAFKGNQKDIMLSLIEGHDTFVLMPTGGGKSLCYQLPALLMEGTAIVVSPLIALMKNQVDAMRNFSATDDVAHFLNSSLNRASVDAVKADVLSGKTKLLYVAPESLTKEDNIAFLKTVSISFYAVDEAHCISEWGHDFRPEYRRIRPIINDICPRPIIALTATATLKVQHDIQKNLGMTNCRVFKSSFNRSNLYYEIRPKTKNVDRDIIRFIKSNVGKSGIIYCLSRKKVEEMAELLRLNDIKSLPYHAGMDAATRSANQDAFLHETVDVIVATIAFGMGIDKPDVRFVIHYDMPKSLEGYYQETGRAGRDGGEGRCITFYSAKDLQKMEKFMQSKPINEQEIGKLLLAETTAYAESAVCRRKSLLHYFGEEYSEENCGNCDNCINPKIRVEAKEDLLAVLDTVAALKEKFNAEHVINVMRGKNTPDIKSYGHNELDVFNCAPNSDDRFLKAVIRQALISGYLKSEIENFGTLHITSEGKKFMRKPASFKIVEDNEYNEEEEVAEIKGGAACAIDPELYNILKDLRRKVAKQANVPPYIIFQDFSLEAMATSYPITIEELQNISGVGVAKAKRYGDEFVKVIRQHVEDNEIERPEDLRIRSTPNKSKQKIAIIQAIDRRVPLDELAEAHNLEFDELLEEIEAIMYSGSKINISYFIDEVIDPDVQDEIFDYFKSTEHDDINAALDELGGDYTEQEIRLMHIKFISEFGN